MGIEEKTAAALPELLAAGDSAESLYKGLRACFEAERAKVAGEEQFKNLRDRWLGRKNGLLASTNDAWLKAAPRELKRDVGRLQNEIKAYIETSLAALKARLDAAVDIGESLDITLPGPARQIGARHPVRMVLEEMLHIFRGLGYSVAEGSEIESFYYNFEALGFPKDHPAVDEMDTFFVTDQMLLRTHTSPIQVRVMERLKPPLRYVVAGKVYRHDAPDSTHSPMFHQL
jgi:phenylalanyl-tRNA synthetase alpha chain